MLSTLSFSTVIDIIKTRHKHNEPVYIHAGHWSSRWWLEVCFSDDHVFGRPAIIDPETLKVVDRLKGRIEYITLDDMLADSFWSII